MQGGRLLGHAGRHLPGLLVDLPVRLRTCAEREVDRVTPRDEVVLQHGHVHGLARHCRHRVVDGHRRLGIPGSDHAHAHEAPTEFAESIGDLVVDDLGARRRGIGLVADRVRSHRDDPAEPEIQGRTLGPDDPPDADGVAVRVHATGRHGDRQRVARGHRGRETASHRSLIRAGRRRQRHDGHSDPAGLRTLRVTLGVCRIFDRHVLLTGEAGIGRHEAHDIVGGERRLRPAVEHVHARGVEAQRDPVGHRVVVEHGNRDGIPLAHQGAVVAHDRGDRLHRLLHDLDLAPRGVGAIAHGIRHDTTADDASGRSRRFQRAQPDPATLIDRGLDPLTPGLDAHALRDEHVTARRVVVGEDVDHRGQLAAQGPGVGDGDRGRIGIGLGDDVDPDAAGRDPTPALCGIRENLAPGGSGRDRHDTGVPIGVHGQRTDRAHVTRQTQVGVRVTGVGTGDVVAERFDLDRLADDSAHDIGLCDRIAGTAIGEGDDLHLHRAGGALGAAVAHGIRDALHPRRHSGEVFESALPVDAESLLARGEGEGVALVVAPVGEHGQGDPFADQDGVCRGGGLRRALPQVGGRVGLGSDDRDGDIGLRRLHLAVVDHVGEGERPAQVLRDGHVDGLAVTGDLGTHSLVAGVTDIGGIDGQDRAGHVGVVVKHMQLGRATRSHLEVVVGRRRRLLEHRVVDEVLVLLVVVVLHLRRRDERVPVVDLLLVVVDIPRRPGVHVVEDDEIPIDPEAHPLTDGVLGQRLERAGRHRGPDAAVGAVEDLAGLTPGAVDAALEGDRSGEMGHLGRAVDPLLDLDPAGSGPSGQVDHADGIGRRDRRGVRGGSRLLEQRVGWLVRVGRQARLHSCRVIRTVEQVGGGVVDEPLVTDRAHLQALSLGHVLGRRRHTERRPDRGDGGDRALLPRGHVDRSVDTDRQ